MIVEAILKTKGSDVVTLHDTADLADAARKLDAHGIGALVVVDRQARPVAVLSERDIVREMALHGPAALERPVSEAMTSAFVTARLDTGLSELMILMTDRRVRHVPIMEKATLLGIISIGDVVKAKIADMEAETAALQAYIRS
ncbi:CBS domain-containing protein [Maricaulis parjimensis]|uniref:CBS domain-containing protein n=1 Tax=Maricaulis parjimensis TaxID=144023 RepID=UPI00193A8DD8|nr:CBS domain-containing protein [Maricaulis parjimensis]